MWKNPSDCPGMTNRHHVSSNRFDLICLGLPESYAGRTSDTASTFSVKSYHNQLAMSDMGAGLRSNGTFTTLIYSFIQQMLRAYHSSRG
jgi:hypothetical protein